MMQRLQMILIWRWYFVLLMKEDRSGREEGSQMDDGKVGGRELFGDAAL